MLTNPEDIINAAAGYFGKRWNMAGDPWSLEALAAEVFNQKVSRELQFSEQQWAEACEQLKPKAYCDFAGINAVALRLAFRAAPDVMTKSLNKFV
jgi:hypothetical protein